MIVRVDHFSQLLKFEFIIHRKAIYIEHRKKTKDYRNVDPASIENEHTQSCKEMQEEKKLEDERTVSMEIVLYIVVCLFNIRRAHSMGSNKI